MELTKCIGIKNDWDTSGHQDMFYCFYRETHAVINYIMKNGPISSYIHPAEGRINIKHSVELIECIGIKTIGIHHEASTVDSTLMCYLRLQRVCYQAETHAVT